MGLGVGAALVGTVGRIDVADGLGAAAGGAAAAVPDPAERPSTGSARRAAATTNARNRTWDMWRCYCAARDNLRGDLRVGSDMSAVSARVEGGVRALESSPDSLLTALYTSHYRELVRLATFLTSDRDSAEEIVQDAYVKVHRSWRGVRDVAKAEAYLRTAVVNLCRSRLRRRQVAARHRPEPLPDMASAEAGALAAVERQAVLQALTRLPRRQREAVVLRYYGDLTEAQTAAAMGCSTGSVKSHTSRAMAALRPLLEDRR